MATGQLFYDPVSRPISVNVSLPLAQYNYYISGTTTPAPVYQDAALTLPYPVNAQGQYIVTADGTGAFAPIFLNPNTLYRVQLITSAGLIIEDTDPCVMSFPVTGSGPISFDAQGEMTINAPLPGGTGIALTITPAASGKPLVLNGSGAGNSAIVVNNTVTVGSNTASFASNNKPGVAAQSVTGTVAPSGTWPGGSLTANWTGVTGSWWTLILSTGQIIPDCTFTNGSAAYTTPSTVITGTPTTALIVQPGPAKWEPVTADGAQYYSPLWQ